MAIACQRCRVSDRGSPMTVRVEKLTDNRRLWWGYLLDELGLERKLVNAGRCVGLEVEGYVDTAPAKSRPADALVPVAP